MKKKKNLERSIDEFGNEINRKTRVIRETYGMQNTVELFQQDWVGL